MQAARPFARLGLGALAGGLLLLLVSLDGGPARSVARAPGEVGAARALGEIVESAGPRAASATTGGGRRAVQVGDSGDLVPLPFDGEVPEVAAGTARLAGRFVRGDAPLAGAWVEVLSGPEQGRRFECAEDGTFEAADLRAGYADVEIGARGLTPLRRSVVLRSARTAPLELDFDAERRVRGSVVTQQGLAVKAARVTLDGAEVLTDRMGRFAIAARASGEAVLRVEQAGFAPCAVRLRDRRDAGLDADDVELRPLRLVPACSLTVSVAGFPQASGPEQAAVLVLEPEVDGPSSGAGSQAYPWSRHGIIPVPASGVVTLHDLPPGKLIARVLHPLASGESEPIRLDPRLAASASVRLSARPTVSTRVSLGGAPYAGARVRLVAADPAKADARALGSANGQRSKQPIDALPSARQSVTTDAEGTATLGWWGETTRRRSLRYHLRVESAEGRLLHAQTLDALPAGPITVRLRAHGASLLAVR